MKEERVASSHASDFSKEKLPNESVFYSDLIQHSPTFYVAISPQGKTIMMNETMLSALGYSSEEVVGTDYMEIFIPEECRENLTKIFQTLSEGDTTHNENMILTQDGRRLLVEWYGRPIFDRDGKFQYFFSMGLDITEQRKAEQALQESESRLSGIISSLADPLYVLDAEGVYTNFFMPNGRTISVSPETFLGKKYSEVLPPEVSGLVKGSLDKAAKGEASAIEYSLLVGDETKYLEAKTSPISTEGQYKGVAVLVQDVTHYKKAEKELEKHREHLEELVEERTALLRESEIRLNKAEQVANLGHFELNIKTGELKLSNEAYRILDIHLTEFGGTFESILDLVHTDDREMVQAAIFNALEKGIFEGVEYRVIRPDGEIRTIFTKADVGRDGEGNPTKLIGVALDITERKAAESALRASEKKLRTQADQLIQAEKMSGLGVMAAGVAHELNNPLMGILNFSQYCLKHTPEDSVAYPVLEDIERESQRCADIVQSMLLFSRVEPKAKKACSSVDLRDLMIKIEHLLTYRLVSEMVDLVVDIPEDAPEFVMDIGKFHQVLINLITNAIDALKGRDEKKITVSLRQYGDKVRITVEDTGKGISPGEMSKIFDPFYTTKEAGKGTGMGLSISHTIINSYGGEIVCESEVDEGTKFHITLDAGGECDDQTSIVDQ